MVERVASQGGLNWLGRGQVDKSDPYSTRLRIPTRSPRLREKDSVLHVFGSELFDTDGLNFEGNISIPTPSNYVLGVNDELVVDVERRKVEEKLKG